MVFRGSGRVSDILEQGVFYNRQDIDEAFPDHARALLHLIRLDTPWKSRGMSLKFLRAIMITIGEQ